MNCEALMMILVTLFVFLSIFCSVSALSQVHITQDGGYTGIVVKIGTNVRMDECQGIINSIKVNQF